MKDSDLRIGNSVKLNGEIATIDCGHILNFTDFGDNIQPIPLTEDLLPKLGIEKYDIEKNDDNIEWYGGFKLYKIHDLYIGVRDSFVYLCESYIHSGELSIESFIEKPIESVHNIQNIVLDLTNKELILK